MPTRLPVAAVLVTAAAGCAIGGGKDRAATFDAVVETVLAPRCTFGSSCHASPAYAAALDLTAERACDMLINKPSCLFPDRMRIVPGQPEDSFFFHKLTGEGLHEVPTSTECTSEATTNLIMPYGAKPLDPDEIALVRDWIAGGAQCMGKGPIEPEPPTIASFLADRSIPLAGESVSFTLALDRPAPEGDLRVFIDTDTSVLAAPLQVVVAAGETTARFDSFALRPTSRFTVTARAGESSQGVVLRIPAIEIAEVFANATGSDDGLQWIKLRNRSLIPIELGDYQLKVGETNYDLITLQLLGTIPPRGCVVVGGPVSSLANGQPVFSQAIDFAPDLPHSRPQATGFALFDRTAVPVGGVLTPLDTMLVGGSNEAELLGPDAEIVTPHCSTPGMGKSAQRNAPGTCVEANLSPSTCF